MNIAILLTSNDTSEFALRFPDDGEKFISILSPHRPDWDFHVIPVMDNVFPESIDQYDGYVITGSPASVNDPKVWIDNLLRFIQELDEHKKPTVGCCFGHQAIAKALGGKVDKNPSGWQLGRAETDFHSFKDWNQADIASISLYSAHCEEVFELPEKAMPVGSNSYCNFASFKIGDHFFTTQYHPEMSFDFMYQLLDYMLDNNEIDQELWKKGKNQIKSQNESEKFAGLMVNFLEYSFSKRQET